MDIEDEVEIDKRVERLKPGMQLRFRRQHHSFLVMATDEVGFHTGRCRYLVACTSCGKLLHEATTGVLPRITQHLNGPFAGSGASASRLV